MLWETPTGEVVGSRLRNADLVVAPDLLDAEVASVLRRGALRGRDSQDSARGRLVRLADAPIVRVPTRAVVLESARFWPNLSAYDALYVAVAARFDATVLTVDGPLARAPAAGVRIENVRVT